jgi:hypothetical protein
MVGRVGCGLEVGPGQKRFAGRGRNQIVLEVERDSALEDDTS